MDIDYRNNQLTYIYFAADGYCVFNEATFAFSLYDSLGYEVLNETMADIGHMIPEDMGKEDIPAFVWVDVYVTDTVTLNPDETYTLVVTAGSFSTEGGQLSPELTCDFLASDYIYIPSIWDHILSFLHSNILFEIIFARLIFIIEFFYYNFPAIPFFPVG